MSGLLILRIGFNTLTQWASLHRLMEAVFHAASRVRCQRKKSQPLNLQAAAQPEMFLSLGTRQR